MAKVVGPLHSSEARGSVGSLTYNTWRGISYVKTRAGPTTQYSADQIAVRDKAAVATAAWQALTDAQRDSWRNYADHHTDIDWTGNPKRITGYNWYVRINVRRLILALGTSTAPPAVPITYAISNFTLTHSVLQIIFHWTDLPWEPQFQQYIEFYVAGPYSAGRHPNIQQADRKTHIQERLGVGSWNSPSAGYYTVFARPLSYEGLVGTFARATIETH